MVASERRYLSFIVKNGEREIPCELLEPAVKHKNPLLLISLTDRTERALHEDPFTQPMEPFADAGHRVLSFDLLCHGRRVDPRYGEHIDGFREMFVAGENVFLQTAEDCAATIDHMLKQGLAHEGGIAICGCSRGGYMALRAFAYDKRISAAAAVAPVTDWRKLKAFERDTENPAVAAQSLLTMAEEFAGRRVVLAIGSDDQVVSTESCVCFHELLNSANRARGYNEELATLFVTDDPGHTLSSKYRRRCGELLLQYMEKQAAGGAAT